MRFCPLLPILALLAASNLALAADAAYRPPRLHDGHVDLQGTWADHNLTPLERPKSIATRLISSEDAARLEAKIADFFDAGGESPEFYDVRGIQAIDGSFRSSLITDPEDGRVPGNEYYKEQTALVFANLFGAFDGPEQRPLLERCLIGSGGPPITAYPVNNLHQIVQTKDNVVIASESLHDTRVIRMNARHAPSAIVSWLGDSIGWWDHDTLVIETKYFAATSRDRLFPYVLYFVSPTTTITERITRVSADELRYVFTIADPAFYTRAWTGETSLKLSADRAYEEACHEGNYALRFILEGARAREASGMEPGGAGELR